MKKYINTKPFIQSGEEVMPGAVEITEKEYNAAPPEYQSLFTAKEEVKPKKNDAKDV